MENIEQIIWSLLPFCEVTIKDTGKTIENNFDENQICCLQNDNSFSVWLITNPQTGFRKKSYTERNCAAEIYIL